MLQNPGRQPRSVLLINPNSLEATTAMMVAIASSAAIDGIGIVGATAARAPSMIVTPDALEAAAPKLPRLHRCPQRRV